MRKLQTPAGAAPAGLLKTVDSVCRHRFRWAAKIHPSRGRGLQIGLTKTILSSDTFEYRKEFLNKS